MKARNFDFQMPPVLSIGIIIKPQTIEIKLREGLVNLARRDYPGRVIIVGKEREGKSIVVIYAITGRSPSSQARKLSKEGDTIWVMPTEEDILKERKAELLVYPALCLSQGIAVSNGRQTLDIRSRLTASQTPSEIILQALREWSYEPDSPIYTPRISGCVVTPERAALSIIKRAEDGSPIRNIFDIPLIKGRGWMISTYQGENKEPLESFSGEPEDVELGEENCEAMAEAIYEALGPQSGEKDFRVAVACVFSHDIGSGLFDVSIINRIERTD